MRGLKINDVNRMNGVANVYQKQGELQANRSTMTKRQDEVQISEAAKEMLSTSKLNEAGRGQRIDQLKQSVASGTYHVEAGKIAEKLLPYLRER